MALEITPTKQYKKDLKKYKHNKKVVERLRAAVDMLSDKKQLPFDYKDHDYVGGYKKYKNVRDCHILPDCVLLYTISSNSVILIRLGNHGNIIENLKKLKISEDTACIASKTSYIDEDGLDKNGIYYFGDKPKLPISWRDIHKKKISKNKERIEENMILREENDKLVTNYYEVDSKKVKDSDGDWTDYTMYMKVEADPKDWFQFLKTVDKNNIEIPEDFIKGYVFVFGDKDFYDPYDEDFDWECETEKEAEEWFDSYTGFEDIDNDSYYGDGYDDFDESYDYDELDEAVQRGQMTAEENGMFLTLDDIMDSMMGNLDDNTIDESVRYYETVSGKLNRKNRFQDITVYLCNSNWLDPLENKSMFDLKPIYKNGKYDAYVGEYNGKKFVVDHFNDRFDFTIYADDESTVYSIIADIDEQYE